MHKYEVGDKFVIEVSEIIENETSHVGPYYKINGFNDFVIDEDHLNTLDVCAGDLESIDWNCIPVDTPVLVRDHSYTGWIPGHFAKYEGNLVYTWNDGRTSWTCYDKENGVTPWFKAKLSN